MPLLCSFFVPIFKHQYFLPATSKRDKFSIYLSIRCRDLNSRPLDGQSLPVTTNPGLPPFQKWSFASMIIVHSILSTCHISLFSRCHLTVIIAMACPPAGNGNVYKEMLLIKWKDVLTRDHLKLFFQFAFLSYCWAVAQQQQQGNKNSYYNYLFEAKSFHSSQTSKAFTDNFYLNLNHYMFQIKFEC